MSEKKKKIPSESLCCRRTLIGFRKSVVEKIPNWLRKINATNWELKIYVDDKLKWEDTSDHWILVIENIILEQW